ncbi:13187_t:CDS:2, partial [Acaulospora morrowiae]
MSESPTPNFKICTLIYKLNPSKYVSRSFRINKCDTLDQIKEAISTTFRLPEFDLYDGCELITKSYESFKNGRYHEISSPGSGPPQEPIDEIIDRIQRVSTIDDKSDDEETMGSVSEDSNTSSEHDPINLGGDMTETREHNRRTACDFC